MMYHANYFSNFDHFEGGYFLGDWFWIMGIGFVILLTVIIIGFLAIGRKKNRNSEVIEVLKTKFAQGEITEEEYVRRKKVLSKR